jgi:glycosyltransferase involved in cell wall biosynthesis
MSAEDLQHELSPETHVIYTPYDVADYGGGVQRSLNAILAITAEHTSDRLVVASPTKHPEIDDIDWIPLGPNHRHAYYELEDLYDFRQRIVELNPGAIVLNGPMGSSELMLITLGIPEEMQDRIGAIWKGPMIYATAYYETLDPVLREACKKDQEIKLLARKAVASLVSMNYVISPHQGEDLLALGIPAHKIKDIQEPVSGFSDPELRYREGVSLRAQFLEEDQLGVFVSGRIIETKGTALLPDIIEEIAHTSYDPQGDFRRIKFTFVGKIKSPDLADAVRKRTSSVLANSDWKDAIDIEFTGFVDQETISSLYAAYDLLLNLSAHEGVCRTNIEAMQAGMPIAANEGCRAARHILSLSAEPMGLLFDTPSTAARQILNVMPDRKRLIDMGENAYQWANTEYTEEKAVADWLGIISELSTTHKSF